jgi:hypothetical protein
MLHRRAVLGRPITLRGFGIKVELAADETGPGYRGALLAAYWAFFFDAARDGLAFCLARSDDGRTAASEVRRLRSRVGDGSSAPAGGRGRRTESFASEDGVRRVLFGAPIRTWSPANIAMAAAMIARRSQREGRGDSREPAKIVFSIPLTLAWLSRT